MVSKNEHLTRSQCPLALGLDIIGDHWTLLIVRDLMLLGKHEYREFLDSPEGISSNILSDRLHKLQEQDLIRAIAHPDNKRRKLYYLTAKGKDLIHVITALVGWSNKHRAEEVCIPAELLQHMQKHPKQFVTDIFQSLANWEAQFSIVDKTAQ